MFGPHLDLLDLWEEAEELQSRGELFEPAVVEPDLPPEAEEAEADEVEEAACDVEPTSGAASSSSGPEPIVAALVPKTSVGQMARFLSLRLAYGTASAKDFAAVAKKK